MDHTTSKSAKIEELSKKGTDVHVAMDGFLHNQKSVSSMVEAHDEAIVSLGSSLKMVEQQVKAMARVLAAANVQNLRRDREEAIQSMRNEVMVTVKKKSDEVTDRMNREFEALHTKKNELSQRFNQCEEKLTEAINKKTDESAIALAGLAGMINKLEQRMQAIEFDNSIARQQAAQYVDAKNAEIKKIVQSVQGAVAAERIRADQNFLKAEQERAKLKDFAQDTIVNAKEDLEDYVRTMEKQIDEKHSDACEDAEKEFRNARELSNQMLGKCQDMVVGSKTALEKLVNLLEDDMDRKVGMIGRQIMEIKKLTDKEAAVREQHVNTLRIALAEEKTNRDNDEQKLLGMISSCMATLDKIHRH